MSSRPARSSSISVLPRGGVPNSPARNIESVISIPFTPRPRIVNQGWQQRSPNTGINSVRGSSSMAVASSPPARSTARSFTHPNSSVLSGTGTSYYEPRIIRADSVCPTSSSVSPSRARRASGTGIRAPSTHKPALSNPSAGPMVVDLAPFSRPAYLDQSALRYLLHTGTPPQLPSSPKSELLRANYGAGRRRSQRSPSFDSDEEEMSHSGELSSQQETIVMSPAPLRLPTRWSDEYRNPLLSVSADGRDLTYQGSPGNPGEGAAAARTIFPIPPACGIYYYEVEVTSKTSSPKNHISVGLVGRDFKPSRLPGWEKNSWGYHGDDGSSFAAEKSGTPYGPQFGATDVIGCGIDFSQNRAFYTKNGALLGSVFDNIGKDCDLYPAVGLCHLGESVRANFGHEAFKFDIEDHVLQQRNAIWTRIQSTSWTWPVVGFDDVSASASNTDTRVKSQINDLVLGYLSHHGYARTARAFEAQSSDRRLKPSSTFASSSTSRVSEHEQIMDMDDVPQTPTISPAPMDDIDIRTRIVHAVLAGDIDTVLADIQTHFPRALDADAGLVLFKLRCRKFVELVLGAAELKKRMRAEEAEMNAEVVEDDKGTLDGMEMDVDDDADASSVGVMNGYGSGGSSAIPIKPKRKGSFASYSHSSLSGAIAAQYGSALESAVAYGQELQSDYKDRPEVRAIFKRTSVIMAFEDPLGAGGDAAEVAGQAARINLATEVNQAILQSQGRPAHPALERIYRQTATCLTQLALMGNGAAAFVDMPREFLDA